MVQGPGLSHSSSSRQARLGRPRVQCLASPNWINNNTVRHHSTNMASHERSVLGILVHIVIALGLFRDCWAQFSPCPANATSCCQCITTPGCSWYSGPLEDSGDYLPRCRPLALVAERPASYSQQHLAPPGLVNRLDIRRRGNRPINARRNRLMRPQTVRLTVGLGMRRVVPIQVKATSRRLQLKIIGPRDGPEFSVRTGDRLSCINRFRVRERRQRNGSGNSRTTRTATTMARRRRSRSSRQRNGRRRGGGSGARRRGPCSYSPSSRQLNVDCYVSAPGDIQNLHLIVDMDRCFSGKKTICVATREQGAKKTKVEVESACSCPCQSEDSVAVPGQEGQCPANQTTTQCVSVDENGQETSACSGVNNYCQRAANESVCSGHGICICSVCICDVVPSQLTAVASSGAVGSQAIQHRYSGWYCQCDDFSCPRSNGSLCGGPDQGMCQCGNCVCREGFMGEACDMVAGEQMCLSDDGLVCSNHGLCVYGACECEENFSGATCEVCNVCRSSCTTLRTCAECLLFPEHTGQTLSCDHVCTPSTNATTLTTIHGEWPDTAEICTFRSHGCFHEYAYSNEFIESGNRVSLYYLAATNCSTAEFE